MPQLGGSEGNARLTSMTAVALLVLLALEGVTVLFIRPLISVHVFVGLLLVPPVALKLASTAWRFVSYYAGRADYVAKGPPQIVLRAVVAPLVVVSTLVLFGTGIAMLAVHPRVDHWSGSTRRASSPGSPQPPSTCSRTSRVSGA